MAEVLVLDAGVVGFATATLLGKDDHHVTVLELIAHRTEHT